MVCRCCVLHDAAIIFNSDNENVDVKAGRSFGQNCEAGSNGREEECLGMHALRPVFGWK